MESAAAPLTALRGIGPKRAAALAEAFGVRTVAELLYVLPRRYQVPPPVKDLLSARDGETIRLHAVVSSVAIWRRGRRSVLRVRIRAGGTDATAVYFNQPYLKDAFPPGRELLLEGRVSRRRGLSLLAPRLLRPEEVARSTLLPVYPEHQGIASGLLPRAIAAALAQALPASDPLPAEVRAAAGVPDLATALRRIHVPSDPGEAESGRRRLAWEEVLALERRRPYPQAAGARQRPALAPRVWERIEARLPFALTADQRQALECLQTDLAGWSPLHRLLHGEVGSGKTALAFALALALAAEGGQTALLAPTEILARQHLRTFRTWLGGARISVAGFLGDDPPAERRAALAALRAGSALIAIGTHALYGPEVQFARLALVVFDEQHRFGVRQKASLLAKGKAPHVLTMTATPIPRTLAWARYGALRPLELRAQVASAAGVQTYARDSREWPVLAAALRPRLEQGARAFAVYPRIDGPAGLLQAAAAHDDGPWRGLPAVAIHGRMPGAEVEAAVAAFRAGEARVLLGTTIVEVGLDLPDVPLMVVHEAQRLGLSSLHQLRGRLARGPRASGGECWLLGNAAELPRLAELEHCRDGFSVARLDLQRRGPGSLRGLRQHGRGGFRAFDPERDEDLLDRLSHPAVASWLESSRIPDSSES